MKMTVSSLTDVVDSVVKLLPMLELASADITVTIDVMEVQHPTLRELKDNGFVEAVTPEGNTYYLRRVALLTDDTMRTINLGIIYDKGKAL